MGELDDRYGRSSTLVATQVPIAEWHAQFPDPAIGDAILDRLIHKAHQLALRDKSRRKIHSPLSMTTTLGYNHSRVASLRRLDGMCGTRG